MPAATSNTIHNPPTTFRSHAWSMQPITKPPMLSLWLSCNYHTTGPVLLPMSVAKSIVNLNIRRVGTALCITNKLEQNCVTLKCRLTECSGLDRQRCLVYMVWFGSSIWIPRLVRINNFEYIHYTFISFLMDDGDGNGGGFEAQCEAHCNVIDIEHSIVCETMLMVGGYKSKNVFTHCWWRQLSIVWLCSGVPFSFG